MHQLHPGLARGPTRLATITGDTGADHIFPGVLTAPIAGYDMVQGKLLGFLPAVLTGRMVTVEDLKASQLSFPAGTPDEVSKADYRRYREAIADRVDEANAVLQHLGLAPID